MLLAWCHLRLVSYWHGGLTVYKSNLCLHWYEFISLSKRRCIKSLCRFLHLTIRVSKQCNLVLAKLGGDQIQHASTGTTGNNTRVSSIMMSCIYAGQKWWQDMQKADAMKSKQVAPDSAGVVKPAAVGTPAAGAAVGTPAAGAAAVKPGAGVGSSAAPAGRGAGRAVATTTGAGRAAPAHAPPRAGPQPARGHIEQLISSVK